MSAQPSVLQVVILRDGLLVGTEVLIPGTYSLGSSGQCDLRLDDSTIAGKHATLYFQNGKTAIQDAGGTTGVFVNGHKVTACQVRSVDEIACGPFVLKTRVLTQKPDAAKPPPEVEALLQRTPAKGSLPASALPESSLATTVPSQKPTPRSARPASAAAPNVAPSRAKDATMFSQRRLAQESSRQNQVEPSNGSLADELFGPPGSLNLDLHGEPGNEDATRPTIQVDVGLAAELFPAPREARPAKAFSLQPAPAAPAPAAPAPKVNGNHAVAARPAIQPRVQEIVAPAPAAPPPRQSAKREHPKAAAIPVARGNTVRPVGGKGKSRLYFELYWGDVRRESRSFVPTPKKPVSAGADELAMMPLYGFTVPEEGFTLADAAPTGFRVFLPLGVSVDRCRIGQPFAPVDAKSLDAENGRRFIALTDGMAARFTSGNMSLVAFVAPKPDRIWTNPLKQVPLLATFTLVLALGGFAWFLQQVPAQPDGADFQAKGMPPVAVHLIAPEPKKKEEAKKKLEEIKQKAVQKTEKKEKISKVEKVVKQVEKSLPKPVQAAPESKAIKALARLSAAGPAMNDMLAAVDKLGNGPGSKFAKASSFKLSNMIGKAPIANAGLGTFGLGGGGRGGIGTLGAEILRGKGGGGIGALGAGGFGKGTVGGTVGHATAHAVGIQQGSIDKEAVAKVVNSHLQEVRACYERALLKDPSIAGKVVLEWVIAQAGHVASVKTKTSTLHNSAVEACIMNELKTWVFPQPRGGMVIITYPFLFNSVGY